MKVRFLHDHLGCSLPAEDSLLAGFSQPGSSSLLHVPLDQGLRARTASVPAALVIILLPLTEFLCGEGFASISVVGL